MVNFGIKLRELRKNAGYTQKQLAEKIWVTKTTISYYEQFERTPSPEILVKLASAFHVSTDYLLGLEEHRKYLDVTDLSEDDIALLQHTIDTLRKKSQNSE